MISIHAPHAGSDGEVLLAVHTLKFQSTLPMRGATLTACTCCKVSQISIHAPHAGSDLTGRKEPKMKRISIHAPHAGSDPQ